MASAWTNSPFMKTAMVVGAAAEIDTGAAELGFVVDQGRQAAGIGRGDQALERRGGSG